MSEFRIFLRIPASSSDALDSIFSNFGKREELASALMIGRSEARNDIYIVGSPRWGAKYRAGKKLEVKFRTRTLRGIEEYRKVKFGKKSIDHYVTEILMQLDAFGIRGSDDEERLVANEQITLQKLRKAAFLDSTSVEICYITVDGQEWVSVAVEGAVEDIQRVLRSERFRCLWVGVMDALRADKQNVVLGGYPSFVRALMRRSTQIEIDEMHEDVQELIRESSGEALALRE